MSPAREYASLEDWIRDEAGAFSLDSPSSFNAAVDRLVAEIGDGVELLGFGEALHGGEEILVLRNRLFQRLVEVHGFGAIAIESSFMRGRVVNAYVAGRGAESYDDVAEAGFSHGFGRLRANQELVEWMREYNRQSSRRLELRFYGFDSPTEMTGTDSPRFLLESALAYLASIDSASARDYRVRIQPLLGQDSDWENPAAMMDPTKAIGRSPAATALRIETEELVSELQVRGPELIETSGEDRYWQALHDASAARQLLTYHAGLASTRSDRTARLLGLREAMMADNLAHVAAIERGRGRTFVFAHNSHLQRGKTRWQLGPQELIWWPVGAHLQVRFGTRYVAIGTAIGVSEANGIRQPELGTLEARLMAVPEPALVIPTHRGDGLPTAEIAALPIRSLSTRNPYYLTPLNPQSFTDFDWIAFVDSTGYAVGAPPLPS